MKKMNYFELMSVRGGVAPKGAACKKKMCKKKACRTAALPPD
jgi:hypothetical protein